MTTNPCFELYFMSMFMLCFRNCRLGMFPCDSSILVGVGILARMLTNGLRRNAISLLCRATNCANGDGSKADDLVKVLR